MIQGNLVTLTGLTLESKIIVYCLIPNFVMGDHHQARPEAFSRGSPKSQNIKGELPNLKLKMVKSPRTFYMKGFQNSKCSSCTYNIDKY